VPFTLAVLPGKSASPKPLKGGQKEDWRREGHEISAGSVKNFRTVGDVEKGTADL
jgi:hypothetical protein